MICKTSYYWYKYSINTHSQLFCSKIQLYFVEKKNVIVRSKQIWKFFIYNKLLAIKFVPLRIHIFLQQTTVTRNNKFFTKYAKRKKMVLMIVWLHLKIGKLKLITTFQSHSNITDALLFKLVTTLFLHIFSMSQLCVLTFKSAPINFSYIYENLFTYFQERKHCKKS